MTHKKGFTLLAVMIVAALMTISATCLWSMTNLDMQAVTNTQRVSQAKLAAMSGITHFTVARFDLASAENGELVPQTVLTPKTSYRVEVQGIDDNKVIVTSWGQYIKSDEVVFEYPIRVLVERN